MKNVNTKGLMLGMLAIGGLIAGGALFTGQAAHAQITVSPVNAAAASNSDDDVVVQANSANVKQKADVKCKAKVSDDDTVQVGNNINTAANACGVTQSSSISQSNTNTDNDVQIAEATACQSLALLIGANICDVTVTADVLGAEE
jgi:hypothetical protein